MEWVIGILILIFIIKFFTKDRYIIVVDIKKYEGVAAKLRQIGKYHAIHYTDIKKLKQYCKKHKIQVMILDPNDHYFGKSEDRAVIATDDMPNEPYNEN